MKSAGDKICLPRLLSPTFGRQLSTVALLAAGVFSGASALAEGTLTGRISNKRTGQSLEGATVTIVELGRTDSTSESGEYVLRGLPNGNYTLAVEYFGLEAKRINVQVTDGIVQQAVELTPEIMEEITVQATRLEGQLRAINQQRAAQGIKTIISEELFGQMNDGNIANAMQKLPGLSVDTDGFSEIPRYVNIRGISTAYNSVQLDGNRLATSGTGRGADYGDTGRGFALDDLPAAAINTIEIVKAPTPDMDHDGLGGSVNLRTRSALDYGGRRVDFKVGGNHNTLRGETSPDLSGTLSDIFELANGRRLGVSVTLSYNETNEGFDNRDEDYFPLRPETPVNQGIANEPISAGGIYPAPTATSVVGVQGPGLAGILGSTVGERGFVSNPSGVKEAIYYHEDTEYNTYAIERERIGLAASFDLELSDSLTMYFRPLYNQEDRFSDDIRYHKIMDNDHNDSCGTTFDAALVNAAIAAGTEASLPSGQKCFLSRRILPDGSAGPLVKIGNSLTNRTTIDYLNENMGRATLDFNGNGRGRIGLQGTEDTQDITLYSLAYGGEKLFDKAVLNWDVNFSRAEKSMRQLDGEWRRDGFVFQYDRTDRFGASEELYPIINGLDPNEVFTDDTDPNRLDQIQENYFQTEAGETVEDRWQIGFNYEHDIAQLSSYSFISGTWKVGARYVTMERSYDYEEVQYDFPDPRRPGYQNVPWASLVRTNPYGSVDRQVMPITMDASATYAYCLSAGSLCVSNSSGVDDSLEQDYTAEENVIAAYAMAAIQAGPLEVVAGVRAEATDFSTVRQLQTDSGGFATVSDGNEYENVLPSLHVKWALYEDWMIRFSAGKTFSRPQIVNLVDIRRVEENDDPVEIEEGNPNLPTLQSTNFDVALEWYRNDGFYSVGAFSKDMTGFSFYATTIIPSDPQFGGKEVRISTPLATGDSRNRGLEVAAYQRFSFLPGALSGIYVNANFTYTLSSATYPNRTENELPTRGASKYLAFAQLGYDYWRINLSLSYRYRSPYVEGLAFVDQQGENTFLEDDMFGEQEIFDINAEFRVTDNISVFGNVTNLFDEIHASRQGYLDTPEDVYYNKRRISVGVKGSF